MTQVNKQRVTQSSIPHVTELRRALGFGHSSDNRLKDATRDWREQYVFSDGRHGKEITEWRPPKAQDDLERMSKDFLEVEGYGLWPDNGSAAPRLVPEYPRDEYK